MTTTESEHESRSILRARDGELFGRTYRIRTRLGTAFITINETAMSEPFEMFVLVGKSGSETTAVAEALGRLISLVLRLSSPLSPDGRLDEVIDQLSGIATACAQVSDSPRVTSLPDALGQVIERYVRSRHATPRGRAQTGTGTV